MEPLTGHTACVRGIVINSTMTVFATASNDKTIIIWHIHEGKHARVRHRLQLHTQGVASISLSPDEKFLVSGSWDKTMRLWDVDTGQEMRTLVGHADPTQAVVWSRDGQYIVSGGGGTAIFMWEAHEKVRRCLCV
jgi:WD40 repeat protein